MDAQSFPAIKPVVAAIKKEVQRIGIAKFHEIAYQNLELLIATFEFDIPTILEWLAYAPIPKQSNFFGESCVTLHYDDDFVVDLYFWSGRRDTAIHDHGFKGAFCVLTGEILQSIYTFTHHHTTSDVHFGRLKLAKTEILTQSSQIQKICSGTRFIHKTAHLISPTITLCIRTTMGYEAQFGYREAGIATSVQRSTSDLQLMSILNHLSIEMNLDEICALIAALIKENRMAMAADFVLFTTYHFKNIAMQEFLAAVNFPACGWDYLINQANFDIRVSAIEASTNVHCTESKRALEYSKLSFCDQI